MLGLNWQSEAHIEYEDIQIEVGDFEWPHPVETSALLDRPQFSLSLTPPPTHSRARYDSDQTAKRFIDIGDLIFVPADVPFQGRSDGGRQRLLVCRFGEHQLNALGRDRTDWNEAELLVGLNLKGSTIRNALARIAQEAISPGFASGALVQALLTTAMIDLLRHLGRGEAGDVQKGTLAPWQLRRVQERVECVDSAQPSIAELAQLCGISPRHLTRSFKKSSGVTLHSYIEEVRLNWAKSLLLETNLPLKTISWQLGFAHSSSFSAAFQRVMGIAPNAFRAQCAKRTDQ